MKHGHSGDAAATLEWGLGRFDLDASQQQRQQLLAFVAMLGKWNRIFNLTAVQDPVQMVIRHILDSLSVLPHVRGTRVLDVGSGAGLPGIPLAVMAPQWEFTLLDKQRKKTRFMTQAVSELQLDNTTVVQGNVADFDPPVRYDTVIARAYASLQRIVQECGRLCAPQGMVMAMKGRAAGVRQAALPAGFRLVDCITLDVPGLQEVRHLLRITPDRV